MDIGLDPAVVAAIIASAVTLFVGIFLHRGQAAIEVKVDGRLEAALEKIDALQVQLSDFTGLPVPPPVAGQSGAKRPEGT